MISLNFLITALAVVLIPGTGVIYTVNAGISGGAKASAFAALGCTLGIVPHVAASVLGLSALINLGAGVFSSIRYLGVAYLLFLAWKTWAGAGSAAYGDSGGGSSLRRIALKGIAINLLNPKLTLFFLSFLPQFIPVTAAGEASGKTALMLALSLVFMLLTLVAFLLYGLVAAKARNTFLKRGKLAERLERGFAAILAGLAVKLALEDL